MTLAAFFGGTGSTMGVFYPTHCMIAVFSNLPGAEQAAERLSLGEFSQEDIVVASGREVLDFDRDGITVARLFVRALSRFFKTAQSFADHDLEHARHNAGFLVIRCGNDDAKETAWSIVKSEDPWDARYYAVGGIEHLAGDPDTD